MNPRPSLRLFLALLAAFLLLGCPTRGGGRGSGSGGDDDDDDSAVGDDDDDDSTSGDDDDSTPGDDDDATPADDDDATPGDDDDDSTGSGPCPPGAITVTETEPNDTPEDTPDIGSITSATALCINGTVTCGAGDDYDDIDFLQFSMGAGEVTLSLYWTTTADMDAYLMLPDYETILISYEEGIATSESDSAAVNAGDHIIQVACWEGTGGSYTAVLEL